MTTENTHHGGICEYCYQTSPFVPLDQPRQPIKHLGDCQRDSPEARARLKAIKARQPKLYVTKMREAARSMVKPKRPTS